MAKRILASVVSGRKSYSRANPRQRFSQPKVRSTTQRFGSNSQPCRPSVRFTISTWKWQCSSTQASIRCSKPPSSQTNFSAGRSAAHRRNSCFAPSASEVRPETTKTPHTSPNVSTSTNRFRPFCRLPPSYPTEPGLPLFPSFWPFGYRHSRRWVGRPDPPAGGPAPARRRAVGPTLPIASRRQSSRTLYSWAGSPAASRPTGIPYALDRKSRSGSPERSASAGHPGHLRGDAAGARVPQLPIPHPSDR